MVIALVGCGKSPEEKKMETDLNADVTKLLDEDKASLDKVADLMNQVDASIMKRDSLVVLYPKLTAGHSVEDLQNAKMQLKTAQDALEKWLKVYRPYNEAMKHQEAMNNLNRAKEDLTNAKSNIEAAVAAAQAALDHHSKLVDELMAQTAKSGGKKGRK
jgi:hypothetical protein